MGECSAVADSAQRTEMRWTSVAEYRCAEVFIGQRSIRNTAIAGPGQTEISCSLELAKNGRRRKKFYTRSRADYWASQDASHIYYSQPERARVQEFSRGRKRRISYSEIACGQFARLR